MMNNKDKITIMNNIANNISNNSNRNRMNIIKARLKIIIWDNTILLSKIIKRTFDIITVAICLVIFSPIFLITAFLIYKESPGPVFYTQIRVGKNGKHFPFFKFRSMVMNADKLKNDLQSENESSDGVIFKMKYDPRITKIGRIIRKYSIDELPQLLNVLFGDMSLVGPRPPIPIEVAKYSLEDRKRLNVTPGITCIWQISGRSEIPFKEQVQLDKNYIKSQSFVTDFMILLKTIPAVLSGDGAY